FWKAGIDSGVTAVDFDVLEVAGDFRLAYEMGHYALRLDGSAEAAERGVYALVHELRHGAWLRTVQLLNPAACTRDRNGFCKTTGDPPQTAAGPVNRSD